MPPLQWTRRVRVHASRVKRACMPDLLKERACQPCEKSVYASLVKRACMPAVSRRFCKVGRTVSNAFPWEALFKRVSTRPGYKVEKCFENTFGKVRPSRSDLTNLRLRATNIWERLFDVVFKWVIRATPPSRSFRPRVK